jgi:beta-galactosidase
MMYLELNLNPMKSNIILLLVFAITQSMSGQVTGNKITTHAREKIKMDLDWKFSLGHAWDTERDFNNGSGYFSYFAKAGYGDGAAAKDFDDRAWRVLDVPHDWCVELPFAADGGHSHGYKAIGRNYPENSVGWYRKTFTVKESDLGKRISIEFDGVHRNSIVWVNGFYLGTEHSGYTGFSYDITDYLNYGGDNVVAVRADATMEEGWYYEGAGIIRHVWLVKTNPLHVDRNGTFVTTALSGDAAMIKSRTTVVNDSRNLQSFKIRESVFDASGNQIMEINSPVLTLIEGQKKEYLSAFAIENPQIWSLKSPNQHSLTTQLIAKGEIIDEYHTRFGIRTVRFDPDSGFYLNGESVKLVGTNLHQDFAGVGRALPDALHEYRIMKLKEMGCNAVRLAHDPPAAEFLDACDRLGLLVMNENRLMGINDEHFRCLRELMKRDRNHPSVVIWSLGNEEWAIEGNEKGARIALTMQDFARRLDSSRAFTVACSGGWDYGIGKVTEVMGYNYMVQGDIDEHHRKFPWQSGIGTEESNTIGTRGIYKTNTALGHLAPRKRIPENVGTEDGWKFYYERPFLAGIFFWTGFDYRGEPSPFGWPAVTSQFGIVDLCGFPKDIFYYLKAWWGDETVLHIMPHWNWPGDEGEEKEITVYSNCGEVELYLNGISLGRKSMDHNGHLQWLINYQPGELEAVGFSDGKEIIRESLQTTGDPSEIGLHADRARIKADREDVAVITVSIRDSKGRTVPTADEELMFSLTGPGRIIGVGNGNPSSHEAERIHESIYLAEISELKELAVDNLKNRSEIRFGFDDGKWKEAFQPLSDDWQDYFDSLLVIRGNFELPELTEQAMVHLFSKSVLDHQSLYINGIQIASDIHRDSPGQSYHLNPEILRVGRNEYVITGQRFRLQHQWDEPNTDPGLVQVTYPVGQWTRKSFNGLAQVIVQSTGEPGEILLTAKGKDIGSEEIKIEAFGKPE